jgi:hypothetical protein
MKNNQETIRIELLQNFKREISLIQPHKELIFYVNQTGGNIWAEFRVEMKPTNNNEWTVTLTDNVNNRIDYLTRSFTTGILDGLKEFIEEKNNHGIGLKGIDFFIENLFYHPVDTKAIGYKLQLLGMMHRIERTRCFAKEILETERSNSFFEIDEIQSDRLEKGHHEDEVRHSRIVPRIFKETIKLKKELRITLYELETRKPTFNIFLTPRIYEDRRPYSVVFSLKKSSNSMFLDDFFSLTDQVDEIIEAIRFKKCNVSGFNIIVSRLFDRNKDRFIKSNLKYLKWAILNCLFTKKYTEIKIENL